MFPQCWCWQNNWSCTDNSPYTDCHQTHLHYKFWLHLPDINQSDWFQLYLWPSMAFKMSQEFPTACLDISHFETKFELGFILQFIVDCITTWTVTVKATETVLTVKMCSVSPNISDFYGRVDQVTVVAWVWVSLAGCRTRRKQTPHAPAWDKK